METLALIILGLFSIAFLALLVCMMTFFHVVLKR